MIAYILFLLLLYLDSSTEICLCCTKIECKSSTTDGSSIDAGAAIKDTGFKDLPGLRFPRFRVPLFQNMFPDDTLMNVFDDFKSDLTFPSFKTSREDLNIEKMIEKLKMPIIDSKSIFKDDIGDRFINNTNSWMKSESHDSQCFLIKGKIFWL